MNGDVLTDLDVSGLVEFLARAKTDIPVLAAITPLESLRHTEFLANEVPGVYVPDTVVDRMRRAEASGRAAAEGLAIASELAAEVRGHVQGIQISTAAGARHGQLMKPKEIRRLIRSASRTPAQRSTTYRILKIFSDEKDDGDSALDKADASQFGSYHQLIKLDKFRYRDAKKEWRYLRLS